MSLLNKPSRRILKVIWQSKAYAIPIRLAKMARSYKVKDDEANIPCCFRKDPCGLVMLII